MSEFIVHSIPGSPYGRAVLATLEETLQLAKIRAVDLDSMLEVGQILPALYVPFNMQQATVQTRFRLLATEVAKFNANQSN